jgi:hypothetical protein
MKEDDKLKQLEKQQRLLEVLAIVAIVMIILGRILSFLGGK